MFAVTNHYAKQAVKDGKKAIYNIKQAKKRYTKKIKVMDDVWKNMHVLPNIAHADQQNFANYNLQKLLHAGFKLAFSKYLDNTYMTNDRYVDAYKNTKKDWCRTMNYGHGYNCIIHMGKNYAITTSRKYTIKPINSTIYIHCKANKKCSTHKSNFQDLKDADQFLNQFYRQVVGYYADKIMPIQQKIDYIKKYGLAHIRKTTNLKLLRAIKSDCLAMQLHQYNTHRFSKTEHRYLVKDFVKFRNLTADNSDMNTLFRFAGISSLKVAINLNKYHAPTQSSYEHMVSSFDVNKTYRDRGILSQLKQHHIKFVQNNTTDIGDPQPYDDSGMASDNTHTVKPLQPDTLASLVDDSQNPDAVEDYM